LRFTPAAIQVINFIATDVGRPVAHIASNLVGYDRLVDDIKDVLDTLAPKEVEVQSKAGAWYLLRIRPYRTRENVIEGAVITFVDITELKQLRQSHRLAVTLRDSHDAVTLQDLEGRCLAWNPAAERIYGWSEAEALAMNVRDRIPEAERAEALSRVQQLSRAEVLESYLTTRLTKDGRSVEVSMTASALLSPAGQVYAITTTERLTAAARGGTRD
jgi:two-component system CheB/CheR fusion protein